MRPSGVCSAGPPGVAFLRCICLMRNRSHNALDGVRHGGWCGVVGLLLVALGSVASAEEPVAPVRLEPVERVTDIGPMRGWLATVDLSDPAVDVVVSDVDGDADLDDADVALAEGAEVVLTPMDEFVGRTGVHLAFNANFFSWKEDAEGNKTQADIIGLSVSDGVQLSAVRKHGEESADPALKFHAVRYGPDENWHEHAVVTRAERFNVEQVKELWGGRLDGEYRLDAVAGIGPSDTSLVPGTLLVQDGENLGLTARVAPTKRHPRTAAGVSEDGKTLYVLVIDGRQIGHSVGATLPEMAALLIEAGADDAVALDGGGSSSLIGRARFVDAALREQADPDGDGWVTNRPSDGRYRAIANQVGIRWLEAGKYDAPPPYVPGRPDVFSAASAPAPAAEDVVPEHPEVDPNRLNPSPTPSPRVAPQESP